MSKKGIEMFLPSTRRLAIVIPWDVIAELCPAEADAFQRILERFGMDDEAFAHWFHPTATIETLAEQLLVCADLDITKKSTGKKGKSMADRRDADLDFTKKSTGKKDKSMADQGNAADATAKARDAAAAWGAAKQSQREGVKNVAKEIIRVWQELRTAFRSATTIDNSCLNLGIAYREPLKAGYKKGNPNNVFFTVDGASRLTPAGEQFRHDLTVLTDPHYWPKE